MGLGRGRWDLEVSRSNVFLGCRVGVGMDVVLAYVVSPGVVCIPSFALAVVPA